MMRAMNENGENAPAPAEPAAPARKGRALCMCSGGLDSMLAMCVLRDQGVAAEAIAFTSPFFSNPAGVTASARRPLRCRLLLRWARPCPSPRDTLIPRWAGSPTSILSRAFPDDLLVFSYLLNSFPDGLTVYGQSALSVPKMR